MRNRTIWFKYSYLWVTLILFLGSFIGHWLFAWFAFVNEQVAHGQTIAVNEYLVEVLRDTFENWQSEFLQLMWQIGGLAFLLFVGSPDSKEGNDRVEEKLDLVLKSVAKDGEEQIKKLDKKYART
jgi:hypothetical protein